MATTPAFTATPRIGVASVSTANTARDGTGTIVSVLTAGANGTRISSITIKATNDPADCMLLLFLHDGSNFWVFDEIDLGNPAAATTTSEAYRVNTTYSDLILPTGWSLQASVTVAPTAGVINVFAHGGDY